MRRLWIGLAALVLTTTGAVVAGATPAHADNTFAHADCPATYLQTATQRACVFWELFPDESLGGDVAVEIELSSNHSQVWGRALATDFFVTVTMYVQQCDGNGHNCGKPIAANSCGSTSSDCNRSVLQTSAKPTAFGHTYRTCASWRAAGVLDFTGTNTCSPFIPA
jgi:hypothetical protein